MRILSYVLSTALASSCLVSPLSAAAAQPEGFGSIGNFMTMDVCTGADGRAVAGIPGDGGCRQHRDIKQGETPAYTLQNFASPRSKCAGGTISKINIPVTKGDNTRIVSSVVRQPSCGKPDGDGGDDLASQSGASIQWHDDGFGFIMGSYSPVALSSFEGDNCLKNSASSARFFRGWVIGPAKVGALGSSGYGIFPSKLRTGGASTLMGSCADRYNAALTTWSVDEVTFKSGRQLVSVIADHYSKGAPGGKSPGDAMQVEQTYWTREFGLSRWEKWAREDWVHPRSKKPAIDLAKALSAAGRCSAPTGKAVRFNAELEVDPGQGQPGVYSKVISNPATGEQHTWYMTLCEDYTNAALSPQAGGQVDFVTSLADDAYWK